MTASAWFSGSFFTGLGWALFHFLWQGTLVAAALAALGVVLARRSPAVRYAVACGALATMLALPAATAWSIAARATRHSGNVSGSASPAVGGAPVPAISVSVGVADGLFTETLRSRVEAFRPWALLAWFAGLLVLSLRFMGGLRTANRLTRLGARPAEAEWQEMLGRLAARLAVTRPVRLLQSAVVKVPTAIGAFRPAILLPASVFTGLPARGLEALIAHELAHVRRYDYLVNLLQTAAETLLFYHPAVWWASSRIRAEREQCCDDLAVAATGDARSYARALVRLEEMRGAAPALAVAAGGGNLWRRVLRLLSESPPSAPGSGWLSGTLALAMVFVIGAAARVGSPEPWEDHGSVAKIRASSPLPDAVVRAPRERVAGLAAAAPIRRRSVHETPSPPDSGSDVTDATPLPDEQSAGDATPEPSASEASTRALTAAEIDSFRIHGVTPESVRHLSALGLGKLSPDDALALKIHGVDAAFVEALHAAGYREISADDAVSARIHGVAPEDVPAWTRLGYPHPSLEDLVAARIHGVSPEFASEIRSAGMKADSIDDLTAFRIHGVTPESVKELSAQGLTDLSGDDAVSFRIHGVTPELVRGVRSLGYTNPSPDDLVALRIHGVPVETIRKANARAGRRVPLDEVVEKRLCGKDGDDDE